MPKRLFIVRHASAEFHSIDGTDFSRVLSQEGVLDAQKMGNWFAQTRAIPDLWLSSSAPRCKTTAEHFIASLPEKQLITRDDLYEAPYQNLLHAIKSNEFPRESVILFGHNPAVSYLVQFLSGEHVSYETGMVAELVLAEETDWHELGANSCVLVSVTKPSDLV